MWNCEGFMHFSVCEPFLRSSSQPVLSVHNKIRSLGDLKLLTLTSTLVFFILLFLFFILVAHVHDLLCGLLLLHMSTTRGGNVELPHLLFEYLMISNFVLTSCKARKMTHQRLPFPRTLGKGKGFCKFPFNFKLKIASASCFCFVILSSL